MGALSATCFRFMVRACDAFIKQSDGLSREAAEDAIALASIARAPVLDVY
jgi:hypothetical protein